jgi:release factor glutamine methyltransferase
MHRILFRVIYLNLLNEQLKNEKFGIIVSNPPYVTDSEKQQMLPNVLQHEPHLALFVPNNDPLIFYKAIADFAIKHSDTNGIYTWRSTRTWERRQFNY